MYLHFAGCRCRYRARFPSHSVGRRRLRAVTMLTDMKMFVYCSDMYEYLVFHINSCSFLLSNCLCGECVVFLYFGYYYVHGYE